MKYIQFIKCFIKLIGTKNWYIGIDKPNFYQWLYKWRMSFKTSYKVSKNIWLNK